MSCFYHYLILDCIISSKTNELYTRWECTFLMFYFVAKKQISDMMQKSFVKAKNVAFMKLNSYKLNVIVLINIITFSD